MSAVIFGESFYKVCDQAMIHLFKKYMLNAQHIQIVVTDTENK